MDFVSILFVACAIGITFFICLFNINEKQKDENLKPNMDDQHRRAKKNNASLTRIIATLPVHIIPTAVVSPVEVRNLKSPPEEEFEATDNIAICRLCQKQMSGTHGVGFPDIDSIELMRKYGRRVDNICRSCAMRKMDRLEQEIALFAKAGRTPPVKNISQSKSAVCDPKKEIVIHLDFTGAFPDLQQTVKQNHLRGQIIKPSKETISTLPDSFAANDTDIVFIDFETATGARDSACSIGIVHTSQGGIVEKNQWLIQPPGNRYDSFNIQIHGITPKMTRDAPTFGELWPEIEKYFSGKTLAAHNASFDMSVLRYSLDKYGIQYPDCKYFCTLVMARACLSDRASHKLDSLCSEFGIAFQHHDAAEDAFAAFEVCKNLLAISGKEKLQDFFDKYNISTGSISPKSTKSCSKRSTSKIYSNFKPEIETNPEHPCFGKRILITGKLESMTRDTAAQKVVNVGGEISNAFSKKVRYLVVGDFEFSRLKDGEKSSKYYKVEEAIKSGQEITILSEDEFLTLLNS